MEARKNFITAVRLTWSSVVMATSAIDYLDEHVIALVQYIATPPPYTTGIASAMPYMEIMKLVLRYHIGKAVKDIFHPM
eukprot:6215836-Lingulodinium_polyedra.AAC.1